MRWISLIVMLLCLGQTETVQVFLANERSNVYANECDGIGTKWVLVNAVTECLFGDAEWEVAILE